MSDSKQFKSPSNDVANILIVDDRRADRLTLAQVLTGPERDLVVAASGAEALRRILERDFAVILLDVLMPEMDGFELASLIKERERSRLTPIIFLTASGSDVSRLYRAYSLGAVDYLYKPIDADVVRAKVSIFVELFRKDQRIRQQAEALHEAERRENELQLAELRLAVERRYINLAEAIPQIVWTSDRFGALTYANRRWSEYTGLDLQRSHGMGWAAAIHADDVDSCLEAWREALAHARSYDVQCRLRRACDNTYRWHIGRAVPETDRDGSVIGWLGTYTDFEELKQALQARDEFLSIASHELRTPLTALKLLVDAMVQAGGATGRLRQRIESADRQTRRLERLVENLLDVSRIATGQFELSLEQLELGELAREVIERFQPEAAQCGVSIELSTSGTATGYWDRLRLEQILTNLLSNALRYGNGSPVRVRIEAEQGGARLVVADSGPGIDATELERIFERFERGSIRRSHGGLGMGLYIAQRIARAHGGSIDATSQIGVGSEFAVRLPIECRATKGS